MMKRKSIFKLLVVGAILSAITFLGYKLLSGYAMKEILGKSEEKVEEIEIARRPLVFWVDATGMLKATSVQNYNAPAEILNYWRFRIVDMAADGANVKAGDTLIRFEVQRLMDDLQRYQTELDQAMKELEKTRVQKDLERQEMLSSLTMAERNLEKQKLKEGTSPEIASYITIELDRLALQQAEKEVALIKEQLEWHKQSSEATIRIIQTRKSRAENRVNIIQRGLEQLEVKATKDGVLVHKVRWNGEKVKVGEEAFSGQSVVEIPQLDTIIAELFVPEVDIGKIKTGQRVEIAIDAFPGKSFYGTVDSQGTLVKPKAYDIPNKILDVQCKLDQLDTSIMRPAMSVKGKIETRTIPDCISIPLKSVLTTPAGSKVKVRVDGTWREQVVKLGESNGAEIVVEDGLNPGDRIAADYHKARS